MLAHIIICYLTVNFFSRVGILHTEAEGPNAYAAATFVKPAPVKEEPVLPAAAESSSDSD